LLAIYLIADERKLLILAIAFLIKIHSHGTNDPINCSNKYQSNNPVNDQQRYQ